MDEGHSFVRVSTNFNARTKKKLPEPVIPARQQSTINKPIRLEKDMKCGLQLFEGVSGGGGVEMHTCFFARVVRKRYSMEDYSRYHKKYK